MKTFIGPIERLRFKEKVDAELRNLKSIFFIILVALPLLVFALFRLNVIQGATHWEADQSSAVAMINAGKGTGTAFLISEDKLITAAHVVEYAEIGDVVTLRFHEDIREYEGVVLCKPTSTDGNKDYAIIELKDKKFKKFFTLGKASDIAKLNDQVLVVGFPGGFTFSSAPGAITNMNAFDEMEFLQLSAGAWPGSSGGPVIHVKSGKVIGILIGGTENEFKGLIFSLKTEVLLNDPELKEIVKFE